MEDKTLMEFSKYEEIAARKYYKEYRRIAKERYSTKLPPWDRLPEQNKNILTEIFKIWVMVGVINPIKLEDLEK